MSHSLYPITQSKNKTFDFSTDFDLAYSIYFDRSAEVFNDERVDKYGVYLGFTCTPDNEKKAFDAKAGATIMHIIAEFFKNNPQSILAYICSGNRNQGRNRQIAFTRWYNSSLLKHNYTYTKKKFDDTYCGVIYNKNHKDVSTIEEAFFDFDLSDKFEFNATPSYIDEMDDDNDTLFDVF